MLVWWAAERNDCGGNTATGVTAMRMVAETRPFTLHNDVGQDWVQLSLLISVFDCVVMESQCCLVCKYYNDS